MREVGPPVLTGEFDERVAPARRAGLEYANSLTALWSLPAVAGMGIGVALATVLAARLRLALIVATGLVPGAAPKESAGAGAAISETANEFGGAAGIALLGSLGAVVYRAELTESAPAGLDLGPARETLSSAFEVAAGLPAGVRGELMIAASRSFVTGIHWVSWIGAGGMVVIAAFVLVALRRVPSTAGGHYTE